MHGCCWGVLQLLQLLAMEGVQDLSVDSLPKSALNVAYLPTGSGADAEHSLRMNSHATVGHYIEHWHCSGFATYAAVGSLIQ